MNKSKITLNKLLTLVIVIFILFYNVFFIACKTNHDCTHHECKICCQIEICLDTFKTIPLIIAIKCFIDTFYLIFLQHKYFYITSIKAENLISLKIKLLE